MNKMNWAIIQFLKLNGSQLHTARAHKRHFVSRGTKNLGTNGLHAMNCILSFLIYFFLRWPVTAAADTQTTNYIKPSEKGIFVEITTRSWMRRSRRSLCTAIKLRSFFFFFVCGGHIGTGRVGHDFAKSVWNMDDMPGKKKKNKNLYWVGMHLIDPHLGPRAWWGRGRQGVRARWQRWRDGNWMKQAGDSMCGSKSYTGCRLLTIPQRHLGLLINYSWMRRL